MQTLCLKKVNLDLSKYTHRRAAEDDFKTLLKEEFKLVDQDTGVVVALYCKPKEPGLRDVFQACKETKFQETYRTSGLKTTSRIFGFNPRNAIRKDFCSITSMATEQPEVHARILNGGKIAAKYYAIHNEQLYLEHLNTTNQKVVKDWKIEGVPFTSGIINDNNPLCYHFDSGNFKNVWSAMVVFKDGISGGHLSMPEYGIACEVSNESIFYFDGQSILHGVTPIKKLRADARRFSIVYYSLRAMWDCQPLREEIARARMRREAVEARRFKGEKVPTSSKRKTR